MDIFVTSGSPLPLYYQLREQMREKIISDEWFYGYEIPSELNLCEMLNLSRATIRQAIDDLVNENMLVRMRGKGTYVTYKKSSNFLTEPSFIVQATKQGLSASTKLISKQYEVIGTKLSMYLSLEPMAKMLHIKRVRCIEGKPIAIDDNYVAQNFMDKLEEVDLEQESIYKHLPYDRCKVTIRPTLLEYSDKQLLNINIDDMPSFPALGMVVETTSFYNDELVMFTGRCYRGDYCNLALEYSTKNNLTELESSSVSIGSTPKQN